MVLLCRRLYGSPETPTPNTENLPHTEQGPSWPFVLAERISLIKNDKELSPELGNVPRWMLREAAAGGRTRGALRLPAVLGPGDLPLQAAGEALQLPEDVHRGASVLLGR